jgi:hypothetical protein
VTTATGWDGISESCFSKWKLEGMKIVRVPTKQNVVPLSEKYVEYLAAARNWEKLVVVCESQWTHRGPESCLKQTS